MRTLIEHLDFALTVDAADTVLRDASMVIDDDRIAGIGPATAIASRFAGAAFARVIDGRMLGVCPGFVDSHVHLSETLSRGLFPDCLSTRAWVFHWAKPFYAHVGEEDERVGAELGITEMLRSGTTCFIDMGSQHDPGIVIEAMAATGIRGITGRHAADRRPAELPRGWTAEMADHHFFPDAGSALATLRDCVRRHDGALGGRARCWVNIEGKEPCSLELHVGARALAAELGVGTTYHLATSIEEARVCERHHGCWPITRIARAGGLGDNLVIAHAAAVADPEIALLAQHDTRIAFCPCSSLKLAKGASAIGRYPELIAAGVAVGLGTDGVAAAGSMNLMRQLPILAGLFKDARMDAGVLGAREALRAATVDGARAALWDHEIGSLQEGMKADFVLFDLDHVEWTPFRDPLQTLVYSASAASIAQTWVDGRPCYADGRVLGVDERGLRARARSLAEGVAARAGLLATDVAIATTLYDEGN